MRDLICICCPIGCQLQVKLDGKEVVEAPTNIGDVVVENILYSNII